MLQTPLCRGSDCLLQIYCVSLQLSQEEQTTLSGGIFLVPWVLFPLDCCCLVTESCPTLLRPHALQPVRLLYPWGSQTRILEWVAISFSRESSPPRDQTFVSCTAGRFFTAEPPGKPSCRLPSFILPDGWQDASLQGSRVEVGEALLQKPQKGLAVGLPLHSPGWSVIHSLSTANNNCL